MEYYAAVKKVPQWKLAVTGYPVKDPHAWDG